MNNLEPQKEYTIDVSVIIPVYNSGRKLIRCVESLLSQSLTSIEIIIIDDGSDGETCAICNNLQEQSNRILVYHTENQGVSAARNYGIVKASGKWIFFADSDDYADTDMLSIMKNAADRYSAELVIAGYFITIDPDELNKDIEVSYHDTVCMEGKNQIRDEMVNLWDSSLMYNVWNKLFLRDLISINGVFFPEGKVFNEDRDFVRKYLSCISNMVVLKECFYHYIKEDKQSAVGKYRNDKLKIRKEEYRNLKAFFETLQIWDEESREYVAREHFDRIVGCVEELFHNEEFTGKERVNRIKEILYDEDTIDAMKYKKAKSLKMKIIGVIYTIRNIYLIYAVTFFIYRIRVNNPQLFNRLRQKR